MRRREQNSTSYPILFFMSDTTDHITGLTGLTPIVTLSKNAGAFASAVGAVSEVGNGWYALAGSSDDRDTLGTLILHAEASGADPFDMDIEILLSDPPTVNEIDSTLSLSHGSGTWSGGLGSGAINWTYTLTDSDTGLPIADAHIWISTDVAATHIIASGTTNQYGQVPFMLDAGTIYVWRAKTLYTFVNPDIEVVS